MSRATLPCFAIAFAAAGCARPGPSPSSAAQPTAQSSACAAPEFRQFDFWIGDWDIALRQRRKPESEEWDEARAENHVRSTQGGCVIEEHFHAEGPESPWNGQSVSTYVPAISAWRQTWVDDQGSYLAFRGAWTKDTMVLTGEPQEKNGAAIVMRMVFRDITRDTLLWSWERGTPGGTTWTAMLVLRYTRRR